MQDAMKEPTTIAAHSRHATSVLFSPDNLIPVSAGMDQTVICSVPSWQPLGVFQGHESSVNALSFSADGAVLASASYDSTVRLWSLESREAIAILRHHRRNVTDMTFSPDGKWLAMAAANGKVRVWDLA